jgi:hypothetical protein
MTDFELFISLIDKHQDKCMALDLEALKRDVYKRLGKKFMDEELELTDEHSFGTFLQNG